MNNDILNEEKELERGIWFADSPDDLVEHIVFYEEPEPDYNLPDKYNKKHPKLYESIVNKYGSYMNIIGYNNFNDMAIKFDTVLNNGEHRAYVKLKQTYQNFKNRELKSPYDCTCCGVGYLGIGPYSKANNKKYYSHWTNMMTRCYNPESLKTRPKYKGCSVHPFFQNFQNFCYWCDQNYYEVGNETMCLDKDILHYHNKIYGPSTCIFVPQRINKLFIFNQTNTNSMHLPVGVHIDNASGLYVVECNIKKESVRVGSFRDPIEAFKAYKKVKEEEIKRVANEYKGLIPDLLYDRLMCYEIDPRR